MPLLDSIKKKAIAQDKTIVLPEALEERTLKAADIILKEGIARIILLGNEGSIKDLAGEHGLEHIDKATIIDPVDFEEKDAYAGMLYDLRKHKGLTKEDALKLVEDPLYLATLLIKNGAADGEVAGAMNATGDVLRPAFQVVKTLPGISVVSGAFIMIMNEKHWGDDGIVVFADCAVHPDPDAKELAEIAVMTARTTQAIVGVEPRVAMLSFSTKGSARHAMVDKVVEATRIAREKSPACLLTERCKPTPRLWKPLAKRRLPTATSQEKLMCWCFPALNQAISAISWCKDWLAPRPSDLCSRGWLPPSTISQGVVPLTTSLTW